ncbi:hypothetical protein GGU11DRAFT_276760 [Lentinula aff. detonsa]|nr:hypothetical protein GGU11DRAFT_276760 [Lentinula aff. detonsa]
MPKASRKSYYAVCVGREGPKIYNSWEECKQNTSRYPGAKHRGFLTYQDAQDWLASAVSLTSNSSRKSSASSDSEVEIVSTRPMPQNTARSSVPAREQMPPTPISDDSDIEIIDAPPLGENDSAPTEIILSPEQKQVLKKVQRGENVFFTGSAGTGKSVLLREIIRHFGSTRKKVAITASTGTNHSVS